tara:strand:+ start:1287 stop:2543 length:1257 start_codon:yes stop_codon:yes gene_type:complete
MTGMPLLLALMLAALPLDDAPAASDAVSLAEMETLLSEQPGAVEQAWTQLTRDGLPRIEPIAGDPERLRVTFFYKAGNDVTEVRLNSVVNALRVDWPVEDFFRDYALPMQRLADSPIWSLSLDVPRDVQASYSFIAISPRGTERVTDPHNPRHLRGRSAEAVLSLDRAGDLSALAPVPQSWLPATELRMIESEALARHVSLEFHPAAEGDEASPVLILYDAFNWGGRAPAWEIVHNLSEAGRIPAMHVVLIDQLDPDSEQSRYADQSAFIVDELLPFLRSEFGLRLSRQDVLLGGASRRGLSATITGLARPGAIGAVLSLSGSFYWAPPGEAPEWLARQLADAPAEAPHFLLAAGSLEYIVTSTNQGHVMLETNRNMAAALGAAGYQIGIHIYPGGHDIAAWRLALADSLQTHYAPAD